MKPFSVSNEKKLNPLHGKLRRAAKVVGAFLADYLNGCNIHGLHYIIKDGLTTFEKCIWSIALIISLYFCIQLGLESVDRYYNKSTVVGVERNYYYWNTTMPSVTICPLARLDKELYEKYSREKNLNETQRTILFDFLENLANTTYTNVRRIHVNNAIDTILDQLNIKPENYMELIYNLTGDKSLKFVKDINNSFTKVRATSGDFIIDTRQILTEYGLCYMTNSFLDHKYSSSYMINGFLTPSDIEQSSLYIKTKQGGYFEDDINYNVLGFDESPINVFLHSPYDVMKIDYNLGFTPESLQLKVGSQETVAENNFVNDVSIERRKCRFQHENNLMHFPIYTMNLCYQECRLNLVFKTCKCVPHFYAKSAKHPKAICDYHVLIDCLDKNEGLFNKFYRMRTSNNCYCLRNCEDAQASIRLKYTMANTNALVGGNSLLLDMVNLPKVRGKRQVIFTLWDLLVSLGSTAGLFLGFSVLSLVEIIYYVTLKIICTPLKHLSK